jgi:hypothetical protein
VRKSPYDPNLLDLKFFDSRGLEVAPDREKAMERLFFMEDFERAPMDGIGTLSFPHAGTDRYRDGLLASVDRDVVRRAGLRMVLDYAFGSASQALFGARRARRRVIALNAYWTKPHSRPHRSFSGRCISVEHRAHRRGPRRPPRHRGRRSLVDEKGEIVAGTSLALVALLVMRARPTARGPGHRVAVDRTAGGGARVHGDAFSRDGPGADRGPRWRLTSRWSAKRWAA